MLRRDRAMPGSREPLPLLPPFLRFPLLPLPSFPSFPLPVMEGKVNKNSYWINMLKLYIWDVIKNCCLHQFLWSSCFYLGRVFSRQKQKMTNPSLPSAMAGAWQGSGPKSRVFPFDDSKTQSSADPKPSSCNVSCFRKKKGKMRFASHSARGEVVFLWDDYWGFIFCWTNMK